METDVQFYAFFRRYPALLFELLGLPVEGQWRMESVGVKSTEKRMDGFVHRVDGASPFYGFVEFQNYWDPNLYWRLYREIATWYESQEADGRPFVAALIFLTRGLDPRDDRLKPGPSCKLLKVYLKEWLTARKDHLSGPWLVFKPLLARGIRQVRREAKNWYRELGQLPMEADDRIFLEQLFQSFLLGRFKALTREEIEQMLQLFPLKESRAVQACMAEARQEGYQDGVRSKLISTLQRYEQRVGFPVSSEEELRSLDITVLEERVDALERRIFASLEVASA
ncbi:MAG: DUF2887 domain-containing protein [Myxococcota bacterium]